MSFFFSRLFLRFILLFINWRFSPTAGSIKNSRKYKVIVSLTEIVSRFISNLEKKWQAIVETDAELSNSDSNFLNRLEAVEYERTIGDDLQQEGAVPEKDLADLELSDESSEQMEKGIEEDLKEIKKEIEGDAFVL